MVNNPMRKGSLFFILLFILFACTPKKDKRGGMGYLNDSTLTNLDGYLFDSTKSYFPEKYFMNGKWVKEIYQDSSDLIDNEFWLHIYSVNLYSFKAPVLYNYYLDAEMYRFLWLRNFDKPVLITLIKSGRGISINTKMLNEKPNIYVAVHNYDGNNIGDLMIESNNTEELWKKYPNADSIVLPHNDLKYLIDTTFEVDSEQWNEFLRHLELCGFWEQKPITSWGGLDGAQWVLEGHTYDKYHFVSRWCPKDHYRQCCEYLIKLSGLYLGPVY